MLRIKLRLAVQVNTKAISAMLLLWLLGLLFDIHFSEPDIMRKTPLNEPFHERDTVQ